MIIKCPECKKKYKYSKEKFQSKEKKKVKCPSCSSVFTIQNPDYKTDIRPIFKDSSSTTTRKDSNEMENVKSEFAKEFLKNKRVSLAFLNGPHSGQICKITKPETTIGRIETDIVIEDPECSRIHAELKILPEGIILKDLNSTNGTYVEGIKITKRRLENHEEFTIGSTNIMLIISNKDNSTI
jgi:predicted Zn finger-like uncharacterized protein